MFDRFHLAEAVDRLYPFQLPAAWPEGCWCHSGAQRGKFDSGGRPLPGMDLEMALEALQCFRGWRTRGRAVVLITHDIDLAFQSGRQGGGILCGNHGGTAPSGDFLRGPEALRHYSKALERAAPKRFSAGSWLSAPAKALPKGCLFAPRMPLADGGNAVGKSP